MANMNFKANILPNSDLTYNIGSTTAQWNFYGHLKTNEETISTNDALVITDASNDNTIVRSTIKFDTTQTDKVLSQAGTWLEYTPGNFLRTTGGTMTGALALNTIVGLEDINYGPILPATPTNGQIFFQTTEATPITSEILNLIYPIGSIYMSVNNTNPGTLFGGVWTQIQDTFLLCAGATYAAGSTGGTATVTLTATEMPSHNHSVGAHAHGLNSHTHSVGAHAHGLNSHTHTYDKANSATGGPSTNVSGGPSTNTSGGPSTNTSGSTTLTKSHIPNYEIGYMVGIVPAVHALWNNGGIKGTGKVKTGDQHLPGTVGAEQSGTQSYGWTISTNGGGTGHTHTLASHTHTLASHTHTNSYTSTTSGAASGNTANSTAFDSGAASGNTANSTAFNSGSKGGGGAHENMPPYLAVYVWQRTA